MSRVTISCQASHLLIKELSGPVQGLPVDSEIVGKAGEQHLGGEQEAVSLLEFGHHLAIHGGQRDQLGAEMGLGKHGLELGVGERSGQLGGEQSLVVKVNCLLHYVL